MGDTRLNWRVKKRQYSYPHKAELVASK